MDNRGIVLVESYRDNSGLKFSGWYSLSENEISPLSEFLTDEVDLSRFSDIQVGGHVPDKYGSLLVGF